MFRNNVSLRFQCSDKWLAFSMSLWQNGGERVGVKPQFGFVDLLDFINIKFNKPAQEVTS